MTIPSDIQPGENLPVTPGNSNRISSLDILRGLGILGLLVISVWQFGGFSNNDRTRLITGTHGGNYFLMNVVKFMFEGKMLSILAMVFGAGIILFFTKKNHPSTLDTPDLYMRRKFWLLLFGIFNAVILLWPGDIFFHLAVVGILIYPFWRMSARGLVIAGMVCTIIFCAKNFWNYSDDKKAYRKYTLVQTKEKKISADSLERTRLDSVWALTRPLTVGKDSATSGNTKDTTRKLLNDSLATAAKNDTLTSEQKKHKDEWEGMIKSFTYDSTATDRNNSSMRASYGKLWNHLLHITQDHEAMWLYKIGIWDIGSMMFFGMALLSLGFFDHRFSRSRYLIMGLACLVIGLLLAWLRIEFIDQKYADYGKYISSKPIPPDQFFPFEKLMLAIGYASMIMLLLRVGIFKWIWKSFAAVGSMALTNYILQTIICTFFFYGYGMGYYGRLSQSGLYGFVLEVMMVQVIFSIFWLRYFTMGPLEWLLARLVYGRWFDIKKPEPDTTSAESKINTDHLAQ